MRRFKVLAATMALAALPSQAFAADAPKLAKQPAAPAKAPAPTPAPLQPTLANVRYGPHERHVLDFWRADSATPAPWVFVIHGGGWQGGEKERVNRFVSVEGLLAAGISVVSINYRFIQHAIAAGVKPPVEWPITTALVRPSESSSALVLCASCWKLYW